MFKKTLYVFTTERSAFIYKKVGAGKHVAQHCAMNEKNCFERSNGYASRIVIYTCLAKEIPETGKDRMIAKVQLHKYIFSKSSVDEWSRLFMHMRTERALEVDLVLYAKRP